MNEWSMAALFLGLVIGLMLRTYWPYLQKEIETFDPKYGGTAFASFIIAVITAYGLMPEAMLDSIGSFAVPWGYFGLFLFGIVYTCGINHTINEILIDIPKRRAE